MRWAPVVPHWCSKPHTPINFPKIWTRKKKVESFDLKCRYWTSSWKQFRKKSQIFLSAPQSLNLSCWPQNAPCKNRARSNYLTRSFNRHQFLSINTDSIASWKKISADSACKVHFEVEIFYTIKRFSGKKNNFFLKHPNKNVYSLKLYVKTSLAWSEIEA